MTRQLLIKTTETTYTMMERLYPNLSSIIDYFSMDALNLLGALDNTLVHLNEQKRTLLFISCNVNSKINFNVN